MINRLSRKTISLLAGCGLMVGSLMVANVMLSTQVVKDGLLIDKYDKEMVSVKSQIQTLEQRLADSQSLHDLSVLAKEQGFEAIQTTKKVGGIEIAMNQR